MGFLHGVGHGAGEAFAMLWETLWALVLGFVLSGAVQAFVSRDRMRAALGDHAPRTITRAGVLGVVSSSCSYAASALAKTLFARGADLTAAIVFMVASTNLVVELGLVLWLLIGWQLALAELVGGVIMIVLLAVVVPRAIPRAWADKARARLAEDSPEPTEPWSLRIRTRQGWADASRYTVGDLAMLRVELVAGFVVAGFLAALVPTGFWQSLFLTGHGFAGSLEDVVLGPLLAVLSFVCSVGNVPLAAALWHGGASLGGVIAFVFADLITLPLLATYRRYYGTAITVRLLTVLWAVMSTAGLAVEYLFRALHVPDPPRPTVIAPGVRWDATTYLDLLALVVLAAVVVLSRTRGSDRYATDPVCGMQVEVSQATSRGGHHFCSDHCAAAYREPARADH